MIQKICFHMRKQLEKNQWVNIFSKMRKEWEKNEHRSETDSTRSLLLTTIFLLIFLVRHLQKFLLIFSVRHLQKKSSSYFWWDIFKTMSSHFWWDIFEKFLSVPILSSLCISSFWIWERLFSSADKKGSENPILSALHLHLRENSLWLPFCLDIWQVFTHFAAFPSGKLAHILFSWVSNSPSSYWSNFSNWKTST